MDHILNKAHFIREHTKLSFSDVLFPVSRLQMCFLHSFQFCILPVLPMSVKVFVEIVDTFVKVMQILSKHSFSNHLPLSDTTLQFIPFPASKPHRAPDQFFWVLFKASQDPDVVIHSKQSPLLVPTINYFEGWHSNPYVGPIGDTQREASAGRGRPAP